MMTGRIDMHLGDFPSKDRQCIYIRADGPKAAGTVELSG